MDLRGFAAALERAADDIGDHAAISACEKVAREFKEQLQSNTPVLTGALRDSEAVDSVSGSGTHATAVISTHLPLYAAFREHGGDIYPKHMLRKGPREASASQSPLNFGELGFLRWEGDDGVHFSRHVRQSGSWYMRRTVQWANSGPAADAARDAVLTILHDAGL